MIVGQSTELNNPSSTPNLQSKVESYDIDSLQGKWKGTIYMIERSSKNEYEIDSSGHVTEQINSVNTTLSRSHLVSKTNMKITDDKAAISLYGLDLFYDISISENEELRMQPVEDENIGLRYYRSIKVKPDKMTLIYFEFPLELFWIEFEKK